MTENDKTLVAWLHHEATFAEDKGTENILNEIAARIEALSAENERLREALERIEREPIPFSANPIAIIIAMKETARAALGDTK